MKIAVFSDVHGNLTALEAVLADIAQQGADTLVFAGDLCLLGPRPAECLARVQELDIPCVYGNTDAWVLRQQMPPERAQAIGEWTLAQLTESAQKWLGGLPFAHRLTPTENPADDLLVVHANPLDVNTLIFPPEAEQVARYGKIRQTDEELERYFAGETAVTIAFGHLHIPSVRHWQDKQLVNISSVNMPGDGDPRAKYALFTWQNGSWAVTHHRVAYDPLPEIAAYEQAQPPGWEAMAQTIRTEGSLWQKV